MAQHTVYTFYAELENYNPKIWRRFEINSDKTIAELGYTIMTMFEMMGGHLFALNIDITKDFMGSFNKKYSAEDVIQVLENHKMNNLQKSLRFEIPFEGSFDDDDFKSYDATEYTIKRIINTTGTVSELEYDFGDGWCVNLVLEKCDKTEISLAMLPRVLEGEGFGIIEDCGGVGGLEELAKAFKKKSGTQYTEFCDWLGRDDLDLSLFDIDDINFRLKKLPRIFKESYEYGYEPTKRSIDLLERKYKQ